MSEEILGKQQTEPKLDRGTPKKKKGFKAFAVFARCYCLRSSNDTGLRWMLSCFFFCVLFEIIGVKSWENCQDSQWDSQSSYLNEMCLPAQLHNGPLRRLSVGKKNCSVSIFFCCDHGILCKMQRNSLLLLLLQCRHASLVLECDISSLLLDHLGQFWQYLCHTEKHSVQWNQTALWRAETQDWMQAGLTSRCQQ